MKSEGVISCNLYREFKQAVEWMEIGSDPADLYHMQTYMAFANDEQDMLEYILDLQNYIQSHKDE